MLVSPTSALAQTTSPSRLPAEVPETNHPTNPDANTIPSEKVSQFVHACVQVVKLIERREGELQGAETESESLRIEQEIEAEAMAIIEKAGLTRQEYLQLLTLANIDPEFGDRVAAQLQEASE
ncbi:MAG: DUF4168 domain-containing protein [Scytolyngbya sp. HA4215-MV1]|nr:DUF4168 domain-containing protein [Scytolyngbya sp. HA4215-MV1]